MFQLIHMFHSYRSGKKKRDINFLRAEATHSPEVLDVAIPLFVLGCAIRIEGTNTTCNIHIKKNPSNNLWCRSEVYQKHNKTSRKLVWSFHGQTNYLKDSAEFEFISGVELKSFGPFPWILRCFQSWQCKIPHLWLVDDLPHQKKKQHI